MMVVKNSKNFEAGFGITFQNHRQMMAVGFFKGWIEVPILFEVLPELEILIWLPVKSPELVSVFIEASKNLKAAGFQSRSDTLYSRCEWANLGRANIPAPPVRYSHGDVGCGGEVGGGGGVG
jgi:hypothetical protein